MTFCIRKDELRDLRICSSVDLIIEMAHKSTKTCRYSDITSWRINAKIDSSSRLWKWSIGVVRRGNRTCSQDQTYMVYNIRQSKIQAKNDLTIDESSSIVLYSMEWNPPEKLFYIILNKSLRDFNRRKLCLWFKFLRLFSRNFHRLDHRIIFHRVKLDLREQYKEGEHIVWWDFLSCTKNLTVLRKMNNSLEPVERKTLFTIESDTGKDIEEHSFIEKENEILLLFWSRIWSFHLT